MTRDRTTALLLLAAGAAVAADGARRVLDRSVATAADPGPVAADTAAEDAGTCPPFLVVAVTQSPDGRPVQGAECSLRGAGASRLRKTAAVGGIARFPPSGGAPSRTATLSVSAPGHESVERELRLGPGWNAVEVRLPGGAGTPAAVDSKAGLRSRGATSAATGRLRWTGHAAFRGHRIEVRSEGGAPVASFRDDGSAREITLPADSYELRVDGLPCGNGSLRIPSGACIELDAGRDLLSASVAGFLAVPARIASWRSGAEAQRTPVVEALDPGPFELQCGRGGALRIGIASDGSVWTRELHVDEARCTELGAIGRESGPARGFRIEGREGGDPLDLHVRIPARPGTPYLPVRTARDGTVRIDSDTDEPLTVSAREHGVFWIVDAVPERGFVRLDAPSFGRVRPLRLPPEIAADAAQVMALVPGDGAVAFFELERRSLDTVACPEMPSDGWLAVSGPKDTRIVRVSVASGVTVLDGGAAIRVAAADVPPSTRVVERRVARLDRHDVAIASIRLSRRPYTVGSDLELVVSSGVTERLRFLDERGDETGCREVGGEVRR